MLFLMASDFDLRVNLSFRSTFLTLESFLKGNGGQFFVGSDVSAHLWLFLVI